MITMKSFGPREDLRNEIHWELLLRYFVILRYFILGH
jgi:hypothetical protein